MVMSKNSEFPKSEIFLNGEVLEQMDNFDYLGSTVACILALDCRNDKDIRIRIVLHGEKGILGEKEYLYRQEMKHGFENQTSKVLCVGNFIVWMQKLNFDCKLLEKVGSRLNVLLYKNEIIMGLKMSTKKVLQMVKM